MLSLQIMIKKWSIPCPLPLSSAIETLQVKCMLFGSSSNFLLITVMLFLH